ncbi:MAG: hypothetical protein ACREO8_09655 [Luteimonas sp.]
MLDAPTTGTPAASGELLAAAPPDMDSLLGDFARQNPSLAWLSQMIAAQRQAAASAPDVGRLPDPQLVEIDALNDALAQTQARHARLQRLARRMADDLDTAQGRLADLAAAFGACGLCWGQDAHCPSCRGRGKPGRFAPDPELRLRFFSEPLPVASRTSTPLDPR